VEYAGGGFAGRVARLVRWNKIQEGTVAQHNRPLLYWLTVAALYRKPSRAMNGTAQACGKGVMEIFRGYF
jgi:hypothetical protein